MPPKFACFTVSVSSSQLVVPFYQFSDIRLKMTRISSARNPPDYICEEDPDYDRAKCTANCVDASGAFCQNYSCIPSLHSRIRKLVFAHPFIISCEKFFRDFVASGFFRCWKKVARQKKCCLMEKPQNLTPKGTGP